MHSLSAAAGARLHVASRMMKSPTAYATSAILLGWNWMIGHPIDFERYVRGTGGCGCCQHVLAAPFAAGHDNLPNLDPRVANSNLVRHGTWNEERCYFGTALSRRK